MKSVSFEIPTQPIAKQRARSTRAGKTYTPARTRQYEDLVAMLARTQRQRFSGDVRVVISLMHDSALVTVHELASSTSKLRGDIDNYAKAILDGLVKGELLANDRQVISLDVAKVSE